MALAINVSTEGESGTIQNTPSSGVEIQPNAGGTTRVAVNPEQGADKPVPKTEDKKKFAGKYDTPEEMETAYLALQTKLGEQKPETKETPAPAPTTPDAARKAVETAGLDLKALNEEYIANDGKLSEESLNKLAEKGVPKETVESYIEGQKALVQKYFDGLHKKVGGEEKFQSLLEWAGVNLSQAEIEATNKAITSFDPAVANIMLAGLQARYTAANGSEPSLVNEGSNVRNQGVKPFGSNEEMVRAMSDRRYKEGDEAYIASVTARLAATETFSVRSY